MAIRKEDIFTGLTKKQRKKAEKFVRKLDKKLRRDYCVGGAVIFTFKPDPGDRMRLKLEEHYRNAGWNVKIDYLPEFDSKYLSIVFS